MFLTGISGPFISIFLALVLPWLVVIFGESTGLQITSESKNVILCTEDQSGSENLQSTYTKTNREKVDKQISSFLQPEDILAFITGNPGYGHPANHTIYYLRGIDNTESRGPPQMFTI